jgi:hypothetical protein
MKMRLWILHDSTSLNIQEKHYHAYNDNRENLHSSLFGIIFLVRNILLT